MAVPKITPEERAESITESTASKKGSCSTARKNESRSYDDERRH